MPVRILTSEQRLRLESFPSTIEPLDLLQFFSLSEDDKRRVPRQTSPWNRLGFALQLCTLRYLGFVPDDLACIPAHVIDFVAHQLQLSSPELPLYGARSQTRTEHLKRIRDHLQFKRISSYHSRKLKEWLFHRALEHDSGSLLLNMACEWLRRQKILRPGLSRLERLVAETKKKAEEETYIQLKPLLSKSLCKRLDSILVVDATLGNTPLTWLRAPATSNSPKAILGNIEKLAFLEENGVPSWDLGALNPNRIKFLAGLARKMTNQALQRAPEERRYPVLVALLNQSLQEITDESIDMFDRLLSHSYARARRDLKEYRETVARATNEKIRLFQELARVLLDPAVADSSCKQVILQGDSVSSCCNSV